MYTCMQGDNSTCISSGRQVPCQAHNACCISGGEAVGGGAWSVACYCNYKAHSHLLNAGKLSAWLTFLSPIQQVDSQYFSVKHPDNETNSRHFSCFLPTHPVHSHVPSIYHYSLTVIPQEGMSIHHYMVDICALIAKCSSLFNKVVFCVMYWSCFCRATRICVD